MSTAAWASSATTGRSVVRSVKGRAKMKGRLAATAVRATRRRISRRRRRACTRRSERSKSCMAAKRTGRARRLPMRWMRYGRTAATKAEQQRWREEAHLRPPRALGEKGVAGSRPAARRCGRSGIPPGPRSARLCQRCAERRRFLAEGRCQVARLGQQGARRRRAPCPRRTSAPRRAARSRPDRGGGRAPRRGRGRAAAAGARPGSRATAAVARPSSASSRSEKQHDEAALVADLRRGVERGPRPGHARRPQALERRQHLADLSRPRRRRQAARAVSSSKASSPAASRCWPTR